MRLFSGLPRAGLVSSVPQRCCHTWPANGWVSQAGEPLPLPLSTHRWTHVPFTSRREGLLIHSIYRQTIFFNCWLSFLVSTSFIFRKPFVIESFWNEGEKTDPRYYNFHSPPITAPPLLWFPENIFATVAPCLIQQEQVAASRHRLTFQLQQIFTSFIPRPLVPFFFFFGAGFLEVTQSWFTNTEKMR